MKRNKNLANGANFKATSIFTPEFLEKVKRKHFSGRLKVFWENGEIRFFKLSTEVEFRLMKKDDDEFEFFEDLS